MLFDPRVHEPLAGGAWDGAAAADAIAAIVRDAEGALGEDFWPVHPLDVDPGDPEVWHGIYLGAAGVVWALDRLGSSLDRTELARAVEESYLRRPEFDRTPGLWLGESGVRLVAGSTERVAPLLVPPEPDTLELCWGSPGLLIAARVLGDDARWDALADHLLARRDAEGFWTQHLYGSVGEILGPAHGMAAIVGELGRRRDVLEPAIAALSATVVREGALANWPPERGLPLRRKDTIRTQWCHGAPGIVASLAHLPRDHALDALLLAGGELTWAAGPLRKGPGLCHGTAGNGFALLKLFTRTGDERWLDRARRFAMHAAAQVDAARREYGRGRYTLWTGDLGTALYLQQCLAATSDMPTIDVF